MPWLQRKYKILSKMLLPRVDLACNQALEEQDALLLEDRASIQADLLSIISLAQAIERHIGPQLINLRLLADQKID
jgi:hypothetical protein